MVARGGSKPDRWFIWGNGGGGHSQDGDVALKKFVLEVVFCWT